MNLGNPTFELRPGTSAPLIGERHLQHTAGFGWTSPLAPNEQRLHVDHVLLVTLNKAVGDYLHDGPVLGSWSISERSLHPDAGAVQSPVLV